MTIRYLMSGPAHLPYLVVSLRTLRAYYQDRVVVYAYPESFEYVKRISMDDRLRIEAVLWEPVYKGKNGQFINKIAMMKSADCHSMYLDADTIVNGDLHPNFKYAEYYGFVGTQFCDWQSNVGTIKGRVSRLLNRQGIDQDAVKKALGSPYPSINGGVFFAKPDCKVLQTWWDWSNAVKDIFICDETALHAVMTHYWNVDLEFRMIRGGAMNCSPKYQPSYLPDEEVLIWHGHGDSFVRKNKSQKGVDLWLPWFNHCLNFNFGYMQEWVDRVKDRYLISLLQGPSDAD